MADQVLALILGFASLAVLARFIPASEIGSLGIAISLMAFVVVLDVVPATVLLRDQIDGYRLNLRMTALYGYALFRLVGLVSVSIVVALVLPVVPSRELVLVTGLYAVSLGIIGIKSVTTEYMFSQYRQARVTQVQVSTRVIQIGAYSLIIFYPTVFMYLAITIGVSLLELSYWTWSNYRSGYRVVGTFFEWWRELQFILKDFAIWSHLVAKSVFLIYWMDAYLLQFYTSSEQIGNYSLALRAGNFLWLLPAIFEKNIIVVVARANSRKARQRYISFLMKAHWFVTAATLVAGTFCWLPNCVVGPGRR